MKLPEKVPHTSILESCNGSFFAPWYFCIIAPIIALFFASPLHADLGKHLSDDHCIILLHGLARSASSMDDMAEIMESEGYVVVNIDYPSRSTTVEKLAMQAIPKGLEKCRQLDTKTINFVTHSMGGILLRYYVSQEEIAELGRVVMLSPPNKGSEVVDSLREYFFFEWQNGPAGQQLGTGTDSLLNTLGPATFPLGIITGDKPAMFDSWLSDIIPGPDDGKVSVESAKLDGMTDFLVLPLSHTFIMDNGEVIFQTIHFLQHQSFFRP